MKEIEKYAKHYKNLQDFRKENHKILLQNFRLEEKEKLEKFILQEKLEMMIEEGKIKEDLFWENDDLEIRVKPKKNRIQIFEKSRYGKKQ